MDAKQFHFRARSIVGILLVLVLIFSLALYNLQVVNYESFRNQSVRSITSVETVEAARGEIVDRYGRELVTNRTTYEVTLNTSVMGEEAERNPNLLSLLAICREEDVHWTDTLPITQTQPFTFITETLTEAGLARYEKLLEKMKWTEAAKRGPDDLLAAMRKWFEVDESVSPEEGRALVGVLYEQRIRTLDIVRTAYIFAQDVDIDFISKVKERALSGITISPVTVRQYATPYAAHLLGRVKLMDGDDWTYYKTVGGYSQNDSVGSGGVEETFESYLRGTAGERAIDTNTEGKIMGETWRTDEETGELRIPRPGNNLALTLDIRLQEVVERSLAARIPALPSDYTQGAAVVVADVNDGSILSMASYPTIDLATIYQDNASYTAAANDPLRPFYNRASMGTYSPGSAFKMIVSTAALQEGVTTPTEKILDTGRFQYPAGEKYPYGDYHPGCWIFIQRGGTHSWEDLAHALKDSCNIYFYTMGDRLGIDKINEYAAMFGLGEPTGFELGENVGQVAGPETSEKLGVTWYGGDLLSAAIGQGNTLTTPLQMANYIATLVNGGDHYSAHILDSVKSSDYSEIITEYEPQLLDSINISPENLEATKMGMLLLAQEGSVAKYFKDLPVSVGAKTGTAQVGQENSNSNAVFVCFAPYENPQIAISIVAERGGSGTELAAIANDILSYYFNTEQSMEAVDGENTLLH